ncbi:MAG TPA: hypothetical protein DDY88_00595 [Actinobacteria bacterium]|nr:hypothetical protein [Actinomycetota bacterium]
MLSLSMWLRWLTLASLTVVTLCGILIIDDEIRARAVHEELREYWVPASSLNRNLLAAERAADSAFEEFVASPSESTMNHARRALGELQLALDQAPVPHGDPARVKYALTSRTAIESWVNNHSSRLLSASSPNARTAILAAEHALIAPTEDLLAQLNNGTAQAREALGRTETVLRYTTVVETALLISLLALLVFGLRYRVLAPLQRLRSDLDASAHQLAHVIRPTGPREIAAVAQDAESMRRSLIHEHDASDQATQALAQSSPLTAAVRAELDRHDRAIAGVIGFHRPIDGVIAGDWWWAGERSDGARVLAIADVSGHGVAAGMLALESRTLVTSALMRGDSPAVICQQLSQRPLAPGMFLTLFIGVLVDNRLTFCSAGHPNAVVVSAEETHELPNTGPIVSALGGTWTLDHRELGENSALILSTDGLLEALPEPGFSHLAHRSWVKSHANAQECLELLLGQAREECDQWTDDVTVMIATVNP